MLNSKQMTKIL